MLCRRLMISVACCTFLFVLQSGMGLELFFVKKKPISEARLLEIFKDHDDKVFGYDISSNQGNIDWDEAVLVRDSITMQFVFIRATAGNNRLDKMFDVNWVSAKENNLVRGAYHYYRPEESPKDQAKMFIQHVVLQKGDFPPVLDIEKQSKTMTMDKLKLNLKKWLVLIEGHYGIKPIIYTGEDYYLRFLKEDFSAYKFWIANYNPSVSYLEDDWLVWQFTDTVIVDGINGPADLNVFHGDMEILLSHTIK